jgi:alpha-glucosidase
MENVPIPPELVQDPPAVNQPEIAHVVGRDPVRTPMQWDGSPNAGFAAAGVAPWLPVAGDCAERNVARQAADPGSMLNLYRALAGLRRAEPALHAGEYRSLDAGAGDVFAYLRAVPGADRFLVVLNFGAGSHELDLGRVARTAAIAVATDVRRQGRVELGSLAVGPNEGLVLRLE